MDLFGWIFQYLFNIILSLLLVIVTPIYSAWKYCRGKNEDKEFSSILITGASKGIGRGLAIELAKRPYDKKIFLLARDTDALNDVREECLKYHPKNEVYIYSVDVTDRQKMREIIREISDIQPLDLVIANAGVTLYTNRDTVTVTDEAVYNLFEINLFGTLNTMFPAVEKMRELNHKGTIVLMSSHAANVPLPGPSAFYSSSKAAILYLQGYREVLRKDGIDLAVIQPGYIQTQMTEKIDDFPLLRYFIMGVDESVRYVVEELEKNNLNISFPRLGYIFSFMGSLIPAFIRDSIWRFSPNLILGERMDYSKEYVENSKNEQVQTNNE